MVLTAIYEAIMSKLNWGNSKKVSRKSQYGSIQETETSGFKPKFKDNLLKENPHHKKSYQCPNCSKKFNTKIAVRAHLEKADCTEAIKEKKESNQPKIKPKERPKKGEYAQFTLPPLPKKHLHKKTKKKSKKQVQCPYCPSLINENNLKKHIRKIHKIT